MMSRHPIYCFLSGNCKITLHKRSILVALLCSWGWFSACLLGQNHEPIDTLAQRLESMESDTIKIRYLLQLSKEKMLVEPSMAVESSLKALYLAKSTPSGEPIIKACIKSVGVACYYSGLLEEAAKYFGEYLEIVKVSGTKRELGTAYNNIVGIKLAKNEYDSTAEKYLKDALRLFQEDAADQGKTLAPVELAGLYNNLGRIFIQKGDFKAAESYYLQGIQLIKQGSADDPNLIRLLIGYAEVLGKANKEQEALIVLEEALDISTSSKIPSMEANVLYSLGIWFDINNSNDKAIAYFDKGYHIAAKIGVHELAGKLSEKLSEAYQEAGNSKSALYYLQLSNGYKKTIRLSEANAKVQQAEITAHFRDLEMAMMSKQTSQSLGFFTLLGIMMVLACLAILAFLHIRKKQRFTLLEKINVEHNAQKLQLENQFLEAEIEVKDKVMATEVLYKIQKNEMVEGVIKKLTNRKNIPKEGEDLIGEAIVKLKESLDHEIWNEFEIRFKQVNAKFYEKLNKLYPDLTANERRLCAFLSLDMTSKEISAITAQSLNSIKVARNRLRKKLQLTHSDKGLTDLLTAIQAQVSE